MDSLPFPAMSDRSREKLSVKDAIPRQEPYVSADDELYVDIGDDIDDAVADITELVSGGRDNFGHAGASDFSPNHSNSVMALGQDHRDGFGSMSSPPRRVTEAAVAAAVDKMEDLLLSLKAEGWTPQCIWYVNVFTKVHIRSKKQLRAH